MSVSETVRVATPVQRALDALQAKRNEEWSLEQLTVQRSFRETLEREADRTRFVQVGDVVGPIALNEVDGELLRLAELLDAGPVVLVFFRYEGCPACNVALPAYRDALWPEIEARGARLVLVSPQAPELLAPIKERLGGSIAVASDPGALLIRSFGIAFSPKDSAPDADAERERLGTLLGAGRAELPYPTVVVVDPDGVVRFVDVHPDWMVRTEVGTVLDALDAIG